MNQTPEELGKKIREARERQGGIQPPKDTDSKTSSKDVTATGRALRASTDLVVALVVGGFLGYWLDKWLGTNPLFMILFFFLGFAAGMLNIYRSQMGDDFKIGFRKKKPAGNEKKED